MARKIIRSYTKEEKQIAVAYYVTCGTIKAVARATNIPYTTIATWKRSEWWLTMVSAAHEKHDEHLDAIFTNTIQSIGEQLQDRVKNGDYRLSKKEELIRVPMSGRDLAVSGGITFEKRSLLRNRPTSIRAIANDEKLLKLKSVFEALVEKKEIVIEGEVVSG